VNAKTVTCVISGTGNNGTTAEEDIRTLKIVRTKP
jgi:hypothetical protein